MTSKLMLLLDYKSSVSSSSSHPPFLLLTTIFSSSFVSATAFSSSFNCSSVTFWRSCPDCASIMSRFSTSVALDSFTSLIRPRRSAAEGSRIWFRMDCRASASCSLSECQSGMSGNPGAQVLTAFDHLRLVRQHNCCCPHLHGLAPSAAQV